MKGLSVWKGVDGLSVCVEGSGRVECGKEWKGSVWKGVEGLSVEGSSVWKGVERLSVLCGSVAYFCVKGLSVWKGVDGLSVRGRGWKGWVLGRHVF